MSEELARTHIDQHQAQALYEWVNGIYFDYGVFNMDEQVVLKRRETYAATQFLISYFPTMNSMLVYVEGASDDVLDTLILSATMNDEQVKGILGNCQTTQRWVLTAYKVYINSYLRGDDES